MPRGSSSDSNRKTPSVNRRTALKTATAISAGALLGAGVHVASGKSRRRKKREAEEDFSDFISGVQHRTPDSLRRLLNPFSVELPRLNSPATVAKPIGFAQPATDDNPAQSGTEFVRSDVYHRMAVNNAKAGGGRRPIAPEVAYANGLTDQDGVFLDNPLLYEITMLQGLHEFFPGVGTPVYGYHSQTMGGGRYPFNFLGPTLMTNTRSPIIVRYVNRLGNVITSIHQHGGHNAREDDGYPCDFIVPEGFDPTASATSMFMEYLLEEECGSPFDAYQGFKEYCFPHLLPLLDGVPDASEAQSTMWYHDHGMDITDENVWRGLAAFYLNVGPVEESLVSRGVLPDRMSAQDVPLVIQDRSFLSNGAFFFDNLDHNGTIGDLFPLNGAIQPKMTVQRRKYRFRFLNGSNSRHYILAVSGDDAPLIQVGTDSWLLPRAIERDGVLLSPAKRADVVIDFTDAPDEVFLENILLQDDGRGPKGKLDDPDVQRPGFPLMKFIVEGPAVPSDNCRVEVGDVLNPVHRIQPSEIERTRHFSLSRSGGAWVVNDTFFNPIRNDTPGLVTGTAERWIIENNGGGWWHPVHIHLEGMQVQNINGQPRDPVFDGLQDLVMLGGGDVAEIFMKFRTFEGPFVWHCHTLAHEDMRMMRNLNGTENGDDGVLQPPSPELEEIDVISPPEDREPGASGEDDR